MVKQSAESQFKCRARKALAEGKDFKVRGGENRAIFEELKKEVAASKERAEASSNSKNELKEGGEALSENAPGVQELYFQDGLGAETPHAGSYCDSDAAESAEPTTVQPEAEQGHASAPGVQDSRLNVGHGSEMVGLRSNYGDTGPQPAKPADPQLIHSLQLFNAEFRTDFALPGVESADDLQDEARRLRKGLAEARAELTRLKGDRVGRLAESLHEAHEELGRLRKENGSLWLQNERLVKHNDHLKTQLAKLRRDVMTDPDVRNLCDTMKGLELKNDRLERIVARHVELNEARAANCSEGADARPAKCPKGFGVGDAVYVASEYWVLMGEQHPKGYNHETRFVIVRQGCRPGFWDLCAKKYMRNEPSRWAGMSLREDAQTWRKQQAQVQSLYAEGHLGHVPARLLNANPSPPAPMSEYAMWIDLTKT